MAEGATDSATLDAYADRPGAARARRRLRLARGHQRDAARPRLPRRRPRPLARDLLRRRADARLAGARAGRRPRPAAARRADQPPRHRVARVARGAPADARRRRRARRPRPLVPGGGRHVGARARGGPREVLQGHVARVAQGEGGARARPRPRDRAPAGGDRAARALRDALPRRHPRAPGAVAGQEARQDGARHPRPARRQGARLRVQAARALRPGRVRDGGRGAADRRARAAARRRAVAGARRARVADRAQRVGQDDADLGARGRARARRRQAAARPQRQARRALPARRGARLDRHRARGRPARHEAHPAEGARAARPVHVLRRGGREAGRGVERRRAPAAVAGDPRALGRQRPDPRRADQPPRPRVARGARGRAPGLPGRGAADLPRPRAARRRRLAHDRGRGQGAALLRRRLGRVPARARGAGAGRAHGQARQAEAGARCRPPRASSGPSKNQRRQAERLEREIEEAEAGLKALEEELADPAAWSSPDRTAKSTRRHDAAKRRLKDLYEQWEAVASVGTERIVP